MKTSQRWITAWGYVAFIYATLEIVGKPVAILRAHDVLRLTLGLLYAICFGSGVWFVRRKAPRNRWRLFLVAGVFVLYLLVARKVPLPEEQIHFFEYGMVGILFTRALRGSGMPKFPSLTGALALGSLAGWMDELLQGFTPGRHFDLRDVVLNMVSIGLGLLVFASLPTEEEIARPAEESLARGV